MPVFKNTKILNVTSTHNRQYESQVVLKKYFDKHVSYLCASVLFHLWWLLYHSWQLSELFSFHLWSWLCHRWQYCLWRWVYLGFHCASAVGWSGDEDADASGDEKSVVVVRLQLNVSSRYACKTRPKKNFFQSHSCEDVSGHRYMCNMEMTSKCWRLCSPSVHAHKYASTGP